MTALMVRRGPDSGGRWLDPEGRCHLGFRRLAILDTSPSGNQPMVSHDDRSVIVFNGEIYNFGEIADDLKREGVVFRSRSDTEVLLEALNLWGTDVLERLNGMFAFAWYRRSDRQLVLARDHAGIKPLYYAVGPNGGLAFASQYNVLLHAPWGVPGDIRPEVLRIFLRLHHLPAPHALLANTYQIPPGHFVVVAAAQGSVRQRSWWTLAPPNRPGLSGTDAVDAVEEVLERVVQRQRIADVPLGVFLSGGIDSPLVAAVARGQTGPGLKAFTISSPGWRQDESREAAAYASRLDVDHRIHEVSADDALGVVDDVMQAQYEPFADFSIVPTLIVSRFARREVTVSLSGDGGDELFFGYERPLSLLRNGKDFRWPRAVRRALYAAGRLGVGPRRSDAILFRTPGEYYLEVNSRLKDGDLARLAPDLARLPADFTLYDSSAYSGVARLADFSRHVEFYGQLQRGLKKVDMASMNESLEVRVPLLDMEIIRVALAIDPRACMRGGTRKAVLRDLLGRHVPPDTIPRPKRGFAVPLGEWLRSGLRDRAASTLFDQPLYPEGLWDRSAVEAYWDDHQRGVRDAKWGLWTLLALQWWAQAHLRPAGAGARPPAKP